MSTLKDVARKAGVSVPTVSRVINNYWYIREATKKKVLKAIEELSYYPNTVARNLKRGKTNTIGFIVPDISNSFFGEVTVGLEKVFRKNDYHLILCLTGRRDDLEIESLQLVVSQKVEGIIINPVGTSGELVKRIINYHRIPLVAIDNKVNNVKTDVVLHNNIEGTQKLTSHLVAHGYKRMAFIGGPLHETSGKKRLEGYKKALVKNGLPVLEDLIRIGDWTKDSGIRLTNELLRMSERPTGIVAANAFMALGVFQALRKENLTIPKDVALVSFDDFEFVAALEPPLTALKSVSIEMGERAARLLLKRINNTNKGDVKEICLPMELMIRNSCGCEGFGNRIDRKPSLT